MPDLDLQPVEQMVQRVGRGPEAVIPILQAIQDHYRYLPEPALRRVCEITEITPAAIEGVASFYGQFRHKPVGEHIIRVCHGTACHVTGSDRVDDALRRHLGIAPGQDTDAARKFTVEPVACLGCCTLAPVVQIDQTTFGHVNPQSAPEIIASFLAHPAAPVVADDEEVFGNIEDPSPTLLKEQLALSPLSKPNGARGDAGPCHGNGNGQAHDHVCRHGHDAQREHACCSQLEQSQGSNGNGAGQRVKPEVAVATVRIGLGSCCIAKGSDQIFAALRQAALQSGARVDVQRVGCVGMCHRTPMVEVTVGGQTSSFYAGVDPARAADLLLRHVRPRGLVRRARYFLSGTLDRLLTGQGSERVTRHAMDMRDPLVTAFLDRQKHIATEHFGKLDPLDLDAYLAHEGFFALQKCLAEPQPEKIVDAVELSGLRGRGGAGFPTARKWRAVRAAAGPVKYAICNGDEGDPGAFMDRMLLESFPYRVIEGLTIAARAVGATEGIFYIRHEYPLAVRRIRQALRICEMRGLLGDNVLGSGWSFRMTIKEGAGAFVCGEETALIASIEGGRGMPRLRPPFPAESGLWERPTLVNNVETLSLLPWILRHGPESFAALGTAHSKGTKVFALAGKVRRGGLIEVPMGTTIRQIVEEIGGGVAPGRKFKAVQIGGPSGGCVPATLADTPVDFEALRSVGAIMGSGGLVVLDDRDCMVDIARYFLQFTQDQSCGKCTFCRIGTRRMLDILERICAGKGRKSDLDDLAQLAGQVSQGSLCGLGKTAPNPVLTTLRYFREEYEAHLQGRCPAGCCKDLIKYEINERCIGCTLCAQHCPVNCITAPPYQRHKIDMEKCTRCDTCRVVCPEQAVEVK